MEKWGKEIQMQQNDKQMLVKKLDELWTTSILTNNSKDYDNYKNFLKLMGARIFLNDKTGEHKILWDKKTSI